MRTLSLPTHKQPCRNPDAKAMSSWTLARHCHCLPIASWPTWNADPDCLPAPDASGFRKTHPPWTCNESHPFPTEKARDLYFRWAPAEVVTADRRPPMQLGPVSPGRHSSHQWFFFSIEASWGSQTWSSSLGFAMFPVQRLLLQPRWQLSNVPHSQICISLNPQMMIV